MTRIFATIAMSILALAVGVRAAEPVERYVLPLVPPYALWFEPHLDDDSGPFQLVEMTSSTGSLTIENGVQRVAVEDDRIFGKSAGGYFIFDAAIGGEVRRYPGAKEWEADLRAAGVEVRESDLADPHTIAANIPDTALRPWRYRVMGATLGLTDDMWSLVVQLIGLVVAFLVGLLRSPIRSLGLVALLIGWGINVVAQVLIAGGGPGAFAGFFILPLFCWISAWLGRLLGLATGFFRRSGRSSIAPAREPI